MSSDTVPDLLKALAILLDTTVRRYAADLQLNPRRPKTILEVRKAILEGHISLRNQQSYYLQVFQRLQRYFLAVDLSPIFLNTGITNETIQQSGKQDCFRCLYPFSSVNINETSCSQILEPKLEYNQDRTSLINQGLL